MEFKECIEDANTHQLQLNQKNALSLSLSYKMKGHNVRTSLEAKQMMQLNKIWQPRLTIAHVRCMYEVAVIK